MSIEVDLAEAFTFEARAAGAEAGRTREPAPVPNDNRSGRLTLSFWLRQWVAFFDSAQCPISVRADSARPLHCGPKKLLSETNSSLDELLPRQHKTRPNEHLVRSETS